MNENRSAPLDGVQAEAIRGFVTEACLGMLATLGSPVSVATEYHAPSAAHDVVGFIGFAGVCRGTLMVSSSYGLFRSSYPLATSAPAPLADLFDWAGEIANQLLGRINRRFCERGVHLDASTPTAVKGRDVGGRSPVKPGVCELAFVVGVEMVVVSFDLSPPPGGKVFADGADPIICVREGELVLF
jgi:CheY-specific phosphatase CheX